MPYVQLPGEVSLFYSFVLGPLDRTKPSLVCLSPAEHSLALLSKMLSHPFWLKWNVVLIDLRFHGRGEAPLDSAALTDFGVHAADVAFAMEKLELPPAHFYCPEVSAFHTGVHLKLLFPELVLSLSFAGIYSLFKSLEITTGIFAEIDECMAKAQTPEDFIEGVTAMIETNVGNIQQCDTDAIDNLASILVNRHDPRHVRALITYAPLRRPFRLQPSHLAQITCPVLVMHGKEDIAHSAAAAEETYNALSGSSDRQLLIVEGGPHCFDLTHEPIVTRRVVEFLTPYATPPQGAQAEGVKLDRAKALAKIAEITGDPSVLSRDPTLATSYHSQSPEVLAGSIKTLEDGIKEAESYKGHAHMDDVSAPWEQRTPGEWRYSARNDSGFAAYAMERRGSAAGVEVSMEVATAEDTHDD